MGLGDRIEERRKEVGISQAELARRVGVRQSTINSLVNGNSRTSRSLLKIARELQTTPAYLTGESDDPAGNLPLSDIVLSSDERDWIELLRGLEIRDRQAVLQLTRSLATSAKSPSIHD
ncbi:helix-turn-helix domain-containing protein [Novosphingobium sp. BL-8A]|uniref:helix-turn-helix domain-containing protein n=1 Tax=Novosphingobium sp. BL-8A TaxID=3127639 RepID=UPI0037572BAD